MLAKLVWITSSGYVESLSRMEKDFQHVARLRELHVKVLALSYLNHCDALNPGNNH